jgi:hypothetical protein
LVAGEILQGFCEIQRFWIFRVLVNPRPAATLTGIAGIFAAGTAIITTWVGGFTFRAQLNQRFFYLLLTLASQGVFEADPVFLVLGGEALLLVPAPTPIFTDGIFMGIGYGRNFNLEGLFRFLVKEVKQRVLDQATFLFHVTASIRP